MTVKKDNSPFAKLKLSRFERSKRNPMMWIILLAIASPFIYFKTYPMYNDWQSKTKEINKFEAENSNLKMSNESKQEKLNSLQNKFNEESAEDLAEEKQIYPDRIDTDKIAKILEIYGLQLENLDFKTRDSIFSVEKLSFGKSSKVKEKDYFTTKLSIEFIADKENISEFITFLQTGELTPQFEDGVKRRIVDPTSKKFLEENLLPLIHVNSIKVTPIEEKESVGSQKYLGKFEVSLFSKKY